MIKFLALKKSRTLNKNILLKKHKVRLFNFINSLKNCKKSDIEILKYEVIGGQNLNKDKVVMLPPNALLFFKHDRVCIDNTEFRKNIINIKNKILEKWPLCWIN